MLNTPSSEQELISRCEVIAGLSVAQLAQRLGVVLPETMRQAKGFCGQLLEMALGACAGSKPLPDFLSLGIELKTIGLNQYAKPKESTFVSSAELMPKAPISWEQSRVFQKLAKVLWVPIEADARIPLAQRRIGQAILWEPSLAQLQILKQDWQEITDMIALGQLEQITARHGRYLQLRPKGANARSLVAALNENGEKILSLPRGFYLRTRFTQKIVNR